MYFVLFSGTCARTQLALLCTQTWEIAPVYIDFLCFRFFKSWMRIRLHWSLPQQRNTAIGIVQKPIHFCHDCSYFQYQLIIESNYAKVHDPTRVCIFCFKLFHIVQEIGLVSFFSEFRSRQSIDQWQMTFDDPLDKISSTSMCMHLFSKYSIWFNSYGQLLLIDYRRTHNFTNRLQSDTQTDHG